MRIQLTWRRSLLVAALLSVATTLSCFKDGEESSSAEGPRVLLAGGLEGEVSITALAIDPGTPSTLYAGMANGGVFKSTDGGVTWNSTGLTTGYVSGIAIDPQTPSTLYATASYDVFKSTDGGTTWTAAGLPGVGWINALVIDPISPTTLYVGGGGAWRRARMAGPLGPPWAWPRLHPWQSIL